MSDLTPVEQTAVLLSMPEDVFAAHNVKPLFDAVARIRDDAVAAAKAEKEQELNVALRERDEAQEWADRLAYSIASVQVIGEHSSSNDPWENALDVIPDAERALVERIEKVLPECYVALPGSMVCADLIGGTFSNGAEWTEEMCCVPCRVRAALSAPSSDTAPHPQFTQFLDRVLENPEARAAYEAAEARAEDTAPEGER